MTLSQNLKQELRLTQIIEFSNLMAVPDEVLNAVVGAVSYNPEIVESTLQRKKEESHSFVHNSEKVRTLYSSLTPSKGDSDSRKSGLIGSPDLKDLKDCLGQYQTAITSDVTYIGRRNEKPELVFSDHLKGSMNLSLFQLDASKYPETSKLLYQLKNFDEWKRKTLKNAYVIIGGTQREFLEDFDKTRYNILNQKNLAEKINVSEGAVSRILSNRWVEARNIAGDQQFLYAKDLLATKNDLKKYNALPILNEILAEEFKNREAYSDRIIAERVPNLARRTIVKYRQSSGIPAYSERNKVYRAEEIEEPFKFG